MHPLKSLVSSPLKPLATGVGVVTTGAIEDYIYCIANGETHEQALKSAAINGPIEGLTVGGCKWLGNALANKVKVSTLTKGPDANIVRDNSAHNAALFEKLRSDYAAKEVREAERIGSALKDDALHRAASFIPEEQLANGKVTSFLGADRKSYTLLQVNGNLNSSNGIYEYIINSSGEITHQRFIIGGKITGFPNQIVPKGGYN